MIGFIMQFMNEHEIGGYIEFIMIFVMIQLLPGWSLGPAVCKNAVHIESYMYSLAMMPIP